MKTSSPDRMSDFGFRMMALTMKVFDFIYPRVDRRVRGFGIPTGVALVDYGCGPGRYTAHFSKVVGSSGKVYAVDIHPIAIQMVQQKIERGDLPNVIPVLVSGYHSGLPDHFADVICVLDMFFGVQQPTALLAELKRIAKPDGFLILDDGHQSRQRTHQKLQAAGTWKVVEENNDHLRCIPVS